MKNDMINFSASTMFPFMTTLKEIPKIELVAFVKRTEKEIEEEKKKAIAVYDFTDYEKKGSVTGILKTGKKYYQLWIESPGITCFPTDSTELFDFYNPYFDFENVEKFIFENIDTSEVTKMEKLFYGFANIHELDLSLFSTRKVHSMYEMFYGCSNLRKLDLNHFDTSNVEDFSAMFGACTRLEKLEINNWDTRNAKQIYWMFSSCEKLIELNIENFQMPKIEYMYEMFQACYSLNKIDMRNFTFNNITLGDRDNDRIFVGMKEDAIIIVKSEREQRIILNLSSHDRPKEWNKKNIRIRS